MIRKPRSDAVDRKRQTATGTGRRKPGSVTAGFLVGDRRRSSGFDEVDSLATDRVGNG